MSATSPKTFLVCHGAWSAGWAWKKMHPLMQAAGHRLITPTYTGLGERAHLAHPGIDLDSHIEDVLNVIKYEDLRDIVLVGHSYGGMVITGVADRVPGRIGNLVYLDAAYPRNGQSLVDVAGPLMLAARAIGRMVDGMELVLYPGEDPMSFYGVTEPEQIAWMKPKLTPHPWKCFEQKLVLDNEAAMRKIPPSFISCSFHMDDAARAALKALSNGRYWELDTGHDLMISEPQAVADVLLQLA